MERAAAESAVAAEGGVGDGIEEEERDASPQGEQ